MVLSTLRLRELPPLLFAANTTGNRRQVMVGDGSVTPFPVNDQYCVNAQFG